MALSPLVYQGNCHCGRYRFKVSWPGEIRDTIVCTCSLCSKKGHLWLSRSVADFQVTRDDGSLIEYQSAVLRHKVHAFRGALRRADARHRPDANHCPKFCSICGTGVSGEHTTGPLSGQTLVNVRAIQGLNPFIIEYPSLEPSL